MESVDPACREAKRHVKQLRGFYRHALTYVVVIGFLTALNLMISPDRWWIQWTAFGWGIGLVSHGFAVFAFSGIFGQDWEERKIKEYLERRQAKRAQGMR